MAITPTELPFDAPGPRCDLSTVCLVCDTPMRPEHAHYRCPACGWRHNCRCEVDRRGCFQCGHGYGAALRESAEQLRTLVENATEAIVDEPDAGTTSTTVPADG